MLWALNTLQIPPWDCVASEAVDDSRLAPPESDEEMEVMTAIYNLANTVIANAASRTLTKCVFLLPHSHTSPLTLL